MSQALSWPYDPSPSEIADEQPQYGKQEQEAPPASVLTIVIRPPVPSRRGASEAQGWDRCVLVRIRATSP